MKKYVIFLFKGLYMPVIFAEHITHSQIKIEGAEAISAGFFYTDSRGTVMVGDERSESLDLGPVKRRDTILISQTLNGRGTMYFLTDHYGI